LTDKDFASEKYPDSLLQLVKTEKITLLS